MKFTDLLGIALIIIVILGGIALVIFLALSTSNYYDLKATIKQCNSDFGVDKWTFIETESYYSCRQLRKETSSNTICELNGIEMPCENMP